MLSHRPVLQLVFVTSLLALMRKAGQQPSLNTHRCQDLVLPSMTVTGNVCLQFKHKVAGLL